MDKTLSSHREPETAHSSSNRQVILSAPQQAALEWLTSGGSITEAAQLAGVCRQTVSEWLNGDTDFHAIYQAWRRQSLDLAEGRMIAITETAMDNIVCAVRDRDLRLSQFVLKQLKVGVGK